MTPDVWALVLAAAIGHALWNFAARRLSGDLVAIWLALSGGCLLLLPVIVGLIYYRGLDQLTTPAGYAYMLATGLLHIAYFLLLSKAYQRGEISVVYPVARGSGIGLTALLAWLFLHEEISTVGALGIGLVFAGIVLMGSPAFRDRSAVRGLGSALWVGASIVAYSLVDKLGVGQVHPVLYIWAMALIIVLALGPRFLGQPQLIRQTWRQNRPYIAFMAVGILGTYLMILFAFTRGPVSYIVAAREFSVVVGSLLGFLLLKERLFPAKIAAILAITAGLILIRMG